MVPQVPVNAELLAAISAIKWQPLDGYRVGSFKGKRVSEHRMLWEAWFGPIPKGHVIHHINHVKDDNRLENLRMMSAADHIVLHKRTDRVRVYSPNQGPQRIDALKAAGICQVCRKSPVEVLATRPSTSCRNCAKKRAEKAYRKASLRWWLSQKRSNRSCPRCRLTPRCRCRSRVCDVCMKQHFEVCPELLRMSAAWEK